MQKTYDVVVIGGGPAGLAAAIGAKESGAKSVVIVERDYELGGILNQCIHNGFGLHYFKEELTGPEYASRFIKMVKDAGIEILLDTMVLSISEGIVKVTNADRGLYEIYGKSVVLAMGCRERTRGAIAIPGDRPAGIFTAGTAQRYLNIEGWMVGRRVVILGSGDIGLIMARRMTLEGADVLACVEVMPYCNGLNRNIVQCLEDYNIPLYLSHTVVEVKGLHRLEEIVIAQVDEHRKPIPGTEKTIPCDTLLLSVGLIPENEITSKAGISLDSVTKGAVVYENFETQMPGVFTCGNVLHVHDLVDYVTEEGIKAGKAAAGYVQKGRPFDNGQLIRVKPGKHVTYTVPQIIRETYLENQLKISFRVNKSFRKAIVTVEDENGVRKEFKREYLSPGEMEHVVLLKDEIFGERTGEICISVVQED